MDDIRKKERSKVCASIDCGKQDNNYYWILVCVCSLFLWQHVETKSTISISQCYPHSCIILIKLIKKADLGLMKLFVVKSFSLICVSVSLSEE